MESQPQNPEFRINPENFHPCMILMVLWYYDSKCLTVPLTVSLYLYHPLMWTCIYQFIDINTDKIDDWLIFQNKLWQHHETTLSYSTSGEDCLWIVPKNFVIGLFTIIGNISLGYFLDLPITSFHGGKDSKHLLSKREFHYRLNIATSSFHGEIRKHGPQHDKACLRSLRQNETQTSLLRGWGENWNFTCVKFRYDTFQKTNNKGADQAAQMRRLVCAFVVHKPQRRFFSHRGPNSNLEILLSLSFHWL